MRKVTILSSAVHNSIKYVVSQIHQMAVQNNIIQRQYKRTKEANICSLKIKHLNPSGIQYNNTMQMDVTPAPMHYNAFTYTKNSNINLHYTHNKVYTIQ